MEGCQNPVAENWKMQSVVWDDLLFSCLGGLIMPSPCVGCGFEALGIFQWILTCTILRP